MKPLDTVRERLAALDQQGLHRVRRISDSPCGVRPTVDGKSVRAFCSNDYLGLAADPRIAQALQEGVERFGVGSGASHLISGHHHVHARLEERLASFLDDHIPGVAALYFSTGYMANVGVLAALAALDEDVEIFSEALNHASLIDGMWQARAPVRVYGHCDVVALESMLSASTANVKVVVTDSVFSMDGDLAPLPQMLALCEKFGAWLLVDDAHGFGTLGSRGHGALEHFSLRSDHLIYVGTLGKAAGVGGAFVAAEAGMIDWLVQRARSYVYSTASPPALAHALLTSLDIIEGPDGAARRQRLQAHIKVLDRELALKQWQRLESATAIQPILIGANEQATLAGKRLHDAGYWVPAIRPPTVPPGTARLRITLSAAHDEADVVELARVINRIEDRHKDMS
ncbi:8-amino-7-oxononanoate synthase [Pusillimonas sp.]|uniref:8-amino-7-oxononanoate synthase n=1 Tax=Pusillimonas sp. TaxID=3040095 RepID=UPI0037C7FBDD